MSMSTESYEIEEAVRIGAQGAARTTDRGLVEGLLVGAETFSMGFDLSPEAANQQGEILRLGTSFVVTVDRNGELVVRAEDASGEMVHLETAGAALDSGESRSVGIGLEDGVLSVTVNGKVAGQVAMSSPVTVNGWDGHDFTIGNPWDNGNYAGTLSGFELSPEPLDLPASTEAEEFTRDPLAAIEGPVDFSFGETVEIGANGSAQTIARSRVEDLLVGAESFALGFEITPEAGGQQGEIMRLGTSFIVEVDRAGELVVRAEVESGERMRLETEGAGMDETGAKDIRLGLAQNELYVLVDGAEVGRMAMPSAITVNGWDGHDFSIGNPWSKGNYQGTLSGLQIVEGELTSQPSPGESDAETPDPTPDQPDAPEETESEGSSGPGDSGEEAVQRPEPDAPNTPDVIVSDAEGLKAALSTASDGETIYLKAGSYGSLSLTGHEMAAVRGVTIASADPEAQASFSGLDLRGVSDLTFKDVVFDYSFDAFDPIYGRPFSVSGGDNIRFEDSLFSGDRASGLGGGNDGYGWGIGLSVRDSANVTVENSEFVDFWKGAVFTESEGLVLRGNEMHGIRSDGMNFAKVRGVLIEENNLHDFDRAWDSLDHADMIQFWTRGSETPSGDITIRGNHLDIGEGGFTQSIFMRNDMVDRGLAGEEMYYQDVTIENNVIVNGHRHGIAVGETAGLVIRDNTVLHGAGNAAGEEVSAIDVPRISVANVSKDVEISGNVTSEIAGWEGQHDWSVGGNVTVQNRDADAPGYYGDVFLSSTLGLQDGQHYVVARPGGEVDVAGAGADSTTAPPEGVSAAFQVITPEGETATRIFDGRYSTGDQGQLPEDARFIWTFADGSTAEGPVVSRAYSGAMDEAVRLRVELSDGTASEAGHALSISDPRLVGYDFGGDFSADDGTLFDISRLLTDEGLDLDQVGKSIDIGKEHVRELAGAEEFAIGFSLDAKGADSDGEVFRYGTSLVVSVTDGGELEVKARMEDGRVTLRTSDARLNDMEQHEVELNLLDGELRLSVDGESKAAATVGGCLVESGNHGLYFGNPWGSDNFEGLLTSFEMTRDASDFAEETMSHVVTPEEADALLAGL